MQRVPLPQSHPDRNALACSSRNPVRRRYACGAARDDRPRLKTVAICNVVDAMVAAKRTAPSTPRRPEIGVASTKAFTAQLTALFLLAMKLGQLRGRLDPDRSARSSANSAKFPASSKRFRSRSAQCEQLATGFSNARDFLYLGRGIHFHRP